MFTQEGWHEIIPEELEEDVTEEGVHVPIISMLKPKHLGIGIPFIVMHLLKYPLGQVKSKPGQQVVIPFTQF